MLESRPVGAGGACSRHSPAPAERHLLAAERHCAESHGWSSADLQAGLRSPTLSLMFFKCPCTLPLGTTLKQKSESDKHFLELSHQELKEREFEVDPENAGEFIPPPHPIPHSPHSVASLQAWFPVSLRGSTSQLWSWLSAGLLQPTGGHRSSPKTPYFQLL